MVDLVFLHIPKTAGTSVRHALHKAYRKEETLKIWEVQHGADIESEDFSNHVVRANVKLITGHLMYKQLIENPSFKNRGLEKPYIFSVVRDPVDRAISLFNYLNVKKPKIRDPALAFFHHAQALPANRQYEYLSAGGISAFDLAESQFICTLENIQPALTSAIKYARPHVDFRSIKLKRFNESKLENSSNFIAREQIGEEALQAVQARSEADYALYNHVCARENELNSGAGSERGERVKLNPNQTAHAPIWIVRRKLVRSYLIYQQPSQIDFLAMKTKILLKLHSHSNVPRIRQRS